jgi:hypothetical protein
MERGRSFDDLNDQGSGARVDGPGIHDYALGERGGLRGFFCTRCGQRMNQSSDLCPGASDPHSAGFERAVSPGREKAVTR